MYYMKCYVQTKILIPTQQTPRAKWRERPKLKPSETKTKSHEPSAKWSQVKPSEAKSQVGTQMGDSSSKMHAKHRF